MSFPCRVEGPEAQNAATTVAVIGAGGWGTALSRVLGNKGHEVRLWVREEDVLQDIVTNRENSAFLPGVKLPPHVKATPSLEEALAGADVVLFTVPSQYLRSVARAAAPHIPRNALVVHGAKGLEVGTLKRMSEVLAEELPDWPASRIACLSGPSHAEEVGRDVPTAVVVASRDREVQLALQDIFMTSRFRVYTNPDIIGVELGGALKNIIAFGTGVADGLGFGDNARAAIMTRGLAEIARLGIALGARPLTFAGLSGMGDLIVTCTSRHSRNRRAGEMLGRGKTLDEIIGSSRMVVESIPTIRAARDLAKRHGVEMPITEQLYACLFEGANPLDAVENLMLRGARHEVEEVAQAKLPAE